MDFGSIAWEEGCRVWSSHDGEKQGVKGDLGGLTPNYRLSREARREVHVRPGSKAGRERCLSKVRPRAHRDRSAGAEKDNADQPAAWALNASGTLAVASAAAAHPPLSFLCASNVGAAHLPRYTALVTRTGWKGVPQPKIGVPAKDNPLSAWKRSLVPGCNLGRGSVGDGIRSQF